MTNTDSMKVKVDEHTFFFKTDSSKHKNSSKKSLIMYDNDFTLKYKGKMVNQQTIITKSKIYDSDNNLIFSRARKKKKFGFHSVTYYLKEKTLIDSLNYKRKIILHERFNLVKLKRIRNKKVLIDSVGVKSKKIEVLPNLRNTRTPN